MTRLVWDVGQYEAGVDRGVFYPRNASGEVWNGLVSVQESPSDGSESVRYVDGSRIQNKQRPGDFQGSIEAFTYPEGLYDHIFGRRPMPFDFSYRVQTENSYKIHLVYNVLLSPSEFEYNQDDTAPFSWEFTTTPVGVPGLRPTAHLIIDGAISHSGALSDFEDVLYGSDDSGARFPSPTEVLDIFELYAALKVIDNGDGTFTVDGPDEAVRMLSATMFEIEWPQAIFIDPFSYTIRSF